MDTLADDLAVAFEALTQSVTDLQTQESAAADELAALATQIKNIKPGTALTPAEVQALTTNVQGVADALKAATAAAAPEPVPTPTPGPSPAEQAVSEVLQNQQ